MPTLESTDAPITCKLVPEERRLDVTAALFGLAFPMRLEPHIYSITENLASEYRGGYWDFYKLSNGAFYMSPHSDMPFSVSCENGFEGQMSADALGIIACLYAYSNLSFSGDAFAELCAEQYHLLKDSMYGHAEVGRIMQAID